MRPITDLAANFVPDQQSSFEVKLWDTPYSFLEGDLASTGMQLRVREPIDVTTWNTYTSGWTGASATTMETAFIAATSTTTVTNGRVPLVQHYWGSGGPNWWGSTKAGQVSVCFSGMLVPTAQRAWLPNSTTLRFAAAGNGLIKIVKVPVSGVAVELLSAELTEVGYLQNGFTLSTTATFATGDTLRVYYLQRGTEDWGGLVVKVLAGTLSGTTDAINLLAADAPVLSAGLFSHETPFAGTTVSFLSQVDITHEMGNASRATVELPLVNSTTSRNDGHGWLFVRSSADDPGTLQLMDLGIQTFTLRRKRLIQITAITPNASGVPTNRVPVFTGFVDDFSDVSDGSARLNCVGFEGRLVEQYEQAPDRISYMSRYFRLTDIMTAETAQRGQPVYNTPAFDAWPLTYAVEELAIRAGIDPSRFRRALTVKSTANVSTTVSPTWLAYQFRAYTTNGKAIRLPRPVHYGNTGLYFTETRPFDDEYLFKVEPTKDLWARVRELTDRLGYRMRFDENGDAQLYPSNNPSHVVDLATTDVVGTVVSKTNPAAYGAKYLETTGVVTVTKVVDAARIDVSFPRGATAGEWTVVVKQGTTTVNTITVNPAVSIATPQFLFNTSLVKPGTNATVVTVWPPTAATQSAGYGTYTVTMTSLNGNASTVRMVDCLLCYVSDPDRTSLPSSLDTGDLAISASAQAQQDEMRNKVTIVGRRKALVTDSDKFAESRQPTEQEFVVQNAVDHLSITDPTALNYVGYPKQSIIYDSSIGDEGFARYLSQVFIYRQRVPKPGANVETVLLPMVQPGDPILVTEGKHDTLSESTVYVRSVTHRYGRGRATTVLEAQSWPDYPAYEPRYDIDLANFNNTPVIDFALSYTTLSGHTVTNLNGDAARPVSDRQYTGASTGSIVLYENVTESGGVIALSGAPWPPMPGTMQVRQRSVAATGSTFESIKTRDLFRYNQGQQLVEMALPPNWVVQSVQADIRDASVGRIYHGPYTVSTDPTTILPFYYKIIGKALVLFAANDRSRNITITSLMNFAGQYDIRLRVFYKVSAGESRSDWVSNNPYHEFTAFSYANGATSVSLPWKQGDETARFAKTTSAWDVRYKTLFPNATQTDPNVRPADVLDNGEPYSPFYDPYTSELGYLVKIGFSTLAEGLYRVSVRSAVDDTIVAWLTGPASESTEQEKHWDYLPVGLNEFYWDGIDQLGEWNTNQSELYATLVDGSFGEDNARERVGKGYYVWNQEVGGGRYPDLAHIWMKRDATTFKPVIGHGTFGKWYIAIESMTDQLPGTVVVDSLGDSNPSNGQYVYTHLPEPTKVSLLVKDWVSATPYSATALTGAASGYVEANWGTPSYTTAAAVNALSAYVNNDKPLLMRFYVEQRPGKLWVGNRDETSVKLTRHAHMRAYIADQTIIDKGLSYTGTTTRDRLIANRRLVNDAHTNTYTDSGYRKSKTFRWAGGSGDTGTTEWIFRPQDFKREFLYANSQQPVTFGNYLQLEEVPKWSTTRDLASERAQLHFALMSYLFYLSAMVTDRSGRTTWGINTTFPDKSKLLNNTTNTAFPDDPMYQIRRTVVCRQWTNETTWKAGQLAKYGGATNGLLDKLLQHWWWQHEASALTLGTTEAQWSSLGTNTDEYSGWHVTNSAEQPKLPSTYSAARQLGTVGSSAVSGWTWSATPAWAPSITRDLHPFFLLPPMCLPPFDVDSVNDFIGDPLGRFVLEYDLRRWNCYLTTAGPDISVESKESGEKELQVNNWGDNAAGETFSSAIFDMTETSANRKRFWLGTRVDKDQTPCKALGVSANSLDYVRQDESVHWEDLRGIYSRSKLPGSGVVKVSPVAPYYLNSMKYYGIGSRTAFRNPGYPAFFVTPNYAAARGTGIPAFRISFRHEYVWESGAFFPSTDRGAERLDANLWWRTRFLSLADVGGIYYDHGAWVGWKDDIQLAEVGGSPRVLGGVMKSFSTTAITDYFTPFAAAWMPVASSTVLPTTVELVTHLVLVPERRGA